MLGTRVHGVVSISVMPLLGACQPVSQQAPAERLIYYSEDRCGGALPKWKKHGAENDHHAEYDRIVIEPAGLVLNDEKVENLELSQYLSASRKRVPRPFTLLVVAPPATCDSVSRTRREIDNAVGCSSSRSCIEYSAKEWQEIQVPPCDADCQAYGRAAQASDSDLTDRRAPDQTGRPHSSHRR